MTQPTWHDLPKEIQEEMLNEPDTIAWDEPVEMLAWDDREENAKSRMVHGKFKGRFVVYYASNDDYNIYKNAKPIIPTINWDEFKEGDVVELMTINDRKYLGFYKVKKSKPKEICISYSDTFFSCVILLKSNIKSIRKLK